MDNIVADKPNLVPETVPVQNVGLGLDAIAAKMAAMKEQTLRNQPAVTNPTETGSSQAAAKESPVAPEGTEVLTDSNTDSISEPEVAVPEDEYIDDNEEVVAPEEVQVSETNSSEADIIDFLEFADSHPNAKFKFKRNGKEIEIDAKKAASILGQGAAISEDARQLKIERAEFDEYLQNKRAETDGLLLAMEFTVKPQLQKAYDEIVKTQGYQTQFQQQLAQTQDPAVRARIQASMQQNERYIASQAQTINQLKPNVDQFYDMRSQQVKDILESQRKGFKDKELRNSAIYDEVREKIAKGWESAKGQLVPGIDNIDLISSDEHLLSLIRDGLKYRDRPKAKSAGSSIAALTTRTGTTKIQNNAKDELSSLQDKARAGDRNAQDNLLVAKMKAMRAQRR
jgi:ribosomal protein S16